MAFFFPYVRVLGPLCLATRLFAEVLVPGNPPLTSQTAAQAASFYEWVLNVRFTDAQTREYENLLAREWPVEGNRRAVLELVRGLEKMSVVPEARKQQMHQQVQDATLEALRKNSQSEDSRWLLAVYRSAHPESAVVISPGQIRPETAAPLTGKWRSSRASSVQYGNRTTGALAPVNGSTFSYQFSADGTYQYTGLLQVTTYGCSSQIYSQDSGTYQQDGDILRLAPSQGLVKTQQNCGSTGSTEKPASLETREYRIRFEQQGSDAVLVASDVAGTIRPDYFRKEK